LRECADATHAEQERDSAEFCDVSFHNFLVVDFLAVTTHVRRSGSVLIAKCTLKEPVNLVRPSAFASGL
jgi:hypothetical protein